jgi:hypothetical protein
MCKSLHVPNDKCERTGFSVHSGVSYFWFHPTLHCSGQEMLSSYLPSQAGLNIWRSLRSWCMKSPCLNCCLLQSILSWHCNDTMSNSSYCGLKLSASQGSDMLFPLHLGGGEWLEQECDKLDNCRHWLSFSLKLRMGFCPAVFLPEL